MELVDALKTTFRTHFGNYNYKMMPFGLKITGATYHRTMTLIFGDMCGPKGLESPPSFCDGLGTIYIVSLQGRTIVSYILTQLKTKSTLIF